MWNTSESGYMPELIDTTSSRNWIYVRRNVREERRIDDTGEETTVYVYEEMKIARENWGLYQAVERNTANIDYIAMMADIEIEGDEEDE